MKDFKRLLPILVTIYALFSAHLASLACENHGNQTGTFIQDDLSRYISPLKSTKNVYVIGHKSPDADTIIGSIAIASYFGYIAARPDQVNPETAYILKRYAQKEPLLVTDTELAGKKFFLVDHSQQTLSPTCLKVENIVGIIDHHPITDGSFTHRTETPIHLFIRTENIGSAVSIVADIWLSDNRRTITPKLAGLMLGAILSDTSGLDNTKAKAADKYIANRLAKIAGLSDAEVQQYWQEMLEAKSDLIPDNFGELDEAAKDKIVKTAMLGDYKQFPLSGHLTGIGVAETKYPQEMLQQKDRIIRLMKEIKKERGLKYLIFSVADVSPLDPAQKSINVITIPGSDDEQYAIQSYGSKPENNIITVYGQTSRKRFLKPKLEAVLKEAVDAGSLEAGNFKIICD